MKTKQKFELSYVTFADTIIRMLWKLEFPQLNKNFFWLQMFLRFEEVWFLLFSKKLSDKEELLKFYQLQIFLFLFCLKGY